MRHALTTARLLCLTTAIAACGKNSATPPNTAAPARKLPFTISKETTSITAPLCPDGTPDYLAALNSRYGERVTPSENGFVLYLDIVGIDVALAAGVKDNVLKMCGAAPTAKRDYWESFESFLLKTQRATGDTPNAELIMNRGMHSLWMPQQIPELVEFLKLQESQLNDISIAANQPHWWAPYVTSNGPEISRLSLPSLAPAREMGDALCARAMLRANTQDFDGYMKDILAAMRIARHVGAGATLIERLIGYALDRDATISIGASVGRGIWNKEQCRKLRTALAALHIHASVADSLNFVERYSPLDSIMHFSLQDPATLAQVLKTKGGFFDIDFSKAQFDVPLKMSNQFFDDLIAATREPSMAEAQKKLAAIDGRAKTWADERLNKNHGSLAPDPGESNNDYSNRVGRGFVGLLAPTIGGAEEFYRYALQTTAMIEPLLAAAEYRADTGGWPKDLAALVPTYLKDIPADRFSPSGTAPVQYKILSNGIVVDSVGFADVRLYMGIRPEDQSIPEPPIP